MLQICSGLDCGFYTVPDVVDIKSKQTFNIYKKKKFSSLKDL